MVVHHEGWIVALSVLVAIQQQSHRIAPQRQCVAQGGQAARQHRRRATRRGRHRGAGASPRRTKSA